MRKFCHFEYFQFLSDKIRIFLEKILTSDYNPEAGSLHSLKSSQVGRKSLLFELNIELSVNPS